MNDMASRGVINSSVTNRGLSDIAQAGGDALNRGYLDAFNSVLGGYQGNASTAAQAGSAFTDSFLNIANGYNNSANSAISLGQNYGNTGSQRVGDLLGVAGGYGNLLNSNLAERDQLLSAVPQYYANAAAPISSTYDMFKTMLEDHWNSDKQDTVVKSGK
jgi:hypothetical protein